MWIGNLILVILNLPAVGLWVNLLKVPLLVHRIFCFHSVENSHYLAETLPLFCRTERCAQEILEPVREKLPPPARGRQLGARFRISSQSMYYAARFRVAIGRRFLPG